MDLHVAGLAAAAFRGGLVEEDAGVGQGGALAGGARRQSWPMDAAKPIATVATSQGMNCIMSYSAIPADTDPPGELM